MLLDPTDCNTVEMANQFENMPRFALETTFASWQSKHMELEMTIPDEDKKDEHDRLIQMCTDKMSLICAQLSKLTMPRQEPIEPVSINQHGSNQALNMKLKVLESAVNQMPTFGAGMEPATFIRDIKNYMPDADCALSKSFLLKKLRQKLSPEYLTAYTNHVATVPITTVDEFCDYISETYESRRSIFQHLEKLDSIAMDDSEMSYRDYAAKVQQEIFDLKTIVRQKFIEVKKKKDSNFTGKLTDDDLFSLMAGTLVLRALKNKPDIFNHTIAKIDDCLTGEEIAQIAQSFSERKQTDDPIFQAPTANFAGKTGHNPAKKNSGNNAKRPAYCHYFQAGKCNKSPCSYVHEIRPLKEFHKDAQKNIQRIMAKKTAKQAEKAKTDREINMLASANSAPSVFQYRP